MADINANIRIRTQNESALGQFQRRLNSLRQSADRNVRSFQQLNQRFNSFVSAVVGFVSLREIVGQFEALDRANGRLAISLNQTGGASREVTAAFRAQAASLSLLSGETRAAITDTQAFFSNLSVGRENVRGLTQELVELAAQTGRSSNELRNQFGQFIQTGQAEELRRLLPQLGDGRFQTRTERLQGLLSASDAVTGNFQQNNITVLFSQLQNTLAEIGALLNNTFAPVLTSLNRLLSGITSTLSRINTAIEKSPFLQGVVGTVGTGVAITALLAVLQKLTTALSNFTGVNVAAEGISAGAGVAGGALAGRAAAGPRDLRSLILAGLPLEQQRNEFAKIENAADRSLLTDFGGGFPKEAFNDAFDPLIIALGGRLEIIAQTIERCCATIMGTIELATDKIVAAMVGGVGSINASGSLAGLGVQETLLSNEQARIDAQLSGVEFELGTTGKDLENTNKNLRKNLDQLDVNISDINKEINNLDNEIRLAETLLLDSSVPLTERSFINDELNINKQNRSRLLSDIELQNAQKESTLAEIARNESELRVLKDREASLSRREKQITSELTDIAKKREKLSEAQLASNNKLLVAQERNLLSEIKQNGFLRDRQALVSTGRKDLQFRPIPTSLPSNGFRAPSSPKSSAEAVLGINAAKILSDIGKKIRPFLEAFVGFLGKMFTVVKALIIPVGVIVVAFNFLKGVVEGLTVGLLQFFDLTPEEAMEGLNQLMKEFGDGLRYVMGILDGFINFLQAVGFAIGKLVTGDVDFLGNFEKKMLELEDKISEKRIQNAAKESKIMQREIRQLANALKLAMIDAGYLPTGQGKFTQNPVQIQNAQDLAGRTRAGEISAARRTFGQSTARFNELVDQLDIAEKAHLEARKAFEEAEIITEDIKKNVNDTRNTWIAIGREVNNASADLITQEATIKRMVDELEKERTRFNDDLRIRELQQNGRPDLATEIRLSQELEDLAEKAKELGIEFDKTKQARMNALQVEEEFIQLRLQDNDLLRQKFQLESELEKGTAFSTDRGERNFQQQQGLLKTRLQDLQRQREVQIGQDDATGLIETENAILETRIQLRDLSREGNQFTDILNDRFGQAFQGLIDGSKSATEAFSDMATAIIQDLAMMIARAAIFNLVMSAFGGGGSMAGIGGFFTGTADFVGGSPAQSFASGGMVEGPMNAPIPVMAHAGEIILNRAQQNNVAAQLGNGGQNIVINNVLRESDIFSAMQKSDGRQAVFNNMVFDKEKTSRVVSTSRI